MLKLTIFGSSSKGNCYLLENNKTKIMLDCGIKKLQDKVDIESINGILLSHAHSDHTKGVIDIKDYYQGKFYSNKETLDSLPIIDLYKQEIKSGVLFSIGTFNIIAFDLMHDVPCYGYLIKDTISNAKILYITDTGMINYKFKDVDYYIIESNCDENDLTYEDYKEVRLYDTHLSMQQTGDFLFKNVNYNTKGIILCHISSSEENYMKHQEYIEKCLNNNAIVVMALDPHLDKPQTIILKEDIKGFDFD